MAPRLLKHLHDRLEQIIIEESLISPDMQKRLAYEFNTTERTIRRIDVGVKLRAAIGVDLRKKLGNGLTITPRMRAFIVKLLDRDLSLY